MRAIIFANGEFLEPQGAKELLRPGDLVIAADGGTRHALSAGVTPDVVIGDLDSLSPDMQASVETAGSQIIRFSPDKDKTDLELALFHAVQEGATEAIVLAALGGRLDQTMANVLLLTRPELDDIDVRIVEGVQEAFLIQDEATVQGQPGDTISLIPLGGDAKGVSIEGVKWPLDQVTLRLGSTWGVSNVLRAEQARVCVQHGSLLCVVMHTSGKKKYTGRQVYK
jgi:thiamine pyrophosphokinase